VSWTYNFEPLLLCCEKRCGTTAEPPSAASRGPSGALLCPECSAPMMLVEYATLAPEATLSDMHRAIPMRGELRR
jgi:hypothetical protein